MTRPAASLVLGLAAALACSGPEFLSEFDPTADFAALESYAWLGGDTGLVEDPAMELESLGQRIRSAVDAELSAKGFRIAGRPDAADFRVRYRTAVIAVPEGGVPRQEVSYGGRGGWEYDFGVLGDDMGGTFSGGRGEQATLVLELTDPFSERVLWRAVARSDADLLRPSAGQEQRLRDAVSRMLAGFPPPSR